MTKPTYQIAHGGAAVQAARIIAAVARDRERALIHQNIIDRYDAMLSAFTHRVECRPEPGTEPCHLRWMLREMRGFTDAGKAGRWLGFVQGLMIERGLTTVHVERDFTRPYFTKPATEP